VLEFVGSDKVAWKLSAEDTRELLKRRKEFKLSDIISLKLPHTAMGMSSQALLARSSPQ